MTTPYASAIITFLDRESGERKAVTYPITSVVLQDMPKDGGPMPPPSFAFEVVDGRWTPIDGVGGP
jgi:hypothetical protein